TLTDRVLELQNSGGTPLLFLQNYTGIPMLSIFGNDSPDTYNVFTNTTAPGGGRQIAIDGEGPSGKKKITDVLNVFYVKPKPKIVHSVSTQDHDAGLVSLTYAAATFQIQYDGIETVTIKQGSAAPLAPVSAGVSRSDLALRQVSMLLAEGQQGSGTSS